MSARQKLSVIVPCYNDESILGELFGRLKASLEKLGLDWEVVFVNDGSGDGTWRVIRELQAREPGIKAANFSRNFGHQAAITAGLDLCAGDAAVIMDSDLQDPPEVIPEMVRRWKEGYHIVYAVRSERRGETWFKIWTADLFYWLIQKLSRTRLPQKAGDFRLLDKSVIQALRRIREHHRYLRGLTVWTGFLQTSVPYEREASHRGQSGYTLDKLVGLCFDAIVSFSIVPLRLSFLLGIFLFCASMIGLSVVIYLKLTHNIPYAGWTSLFVGLVFFSSLQFLILGIVGEYVGRIYEESKKRPLYLLQETLGIERGPDERNEH